MGLLPADKKKRKSEDGLAGGNEDSQQNQHFQIDSVHLTYQFHIFNVVAVHIGNSILCRTLFLIQVDLAGSCAILF